MSDNARLALVVAFFLGILIYSVIYMFLNPG